MRKKINKSDHQLKLYDNLEIHPKYFVARKFYNLRLGKKFCGGYIRFFFVGSMKLNKKNKE